MNRIKDVWPKWEGVEILGEGGFGTVYKAKKDSFAGEEFCAVKIVKIPNSRHEADEMMSSGFTENNIKEYYHKSALNLVDEIKMMQKMKAASHVVSIEDYEVVENKDHIGYTIFIRMELLTNITKYFKSREITVSEVVKMAIDILTALEFCHSQNIMHRDIKPANIFISEFGEYKLGDFGISKEVEKTNATLSQKGTKSYMAPEMIRMEKYGKNVDLYALGLTMFELLNHGRMPFLSPYPQPIFPEDREKAIERRLKGETFPDIDGIGDLNIIIKKACHSNKEQRYQSASEMKKDLLSIYLENKTLPQEIFTNEATQSLFNNELTIGAQSSFEEKTMGVFDQKPKNEFLFEDTITKPQPQSVVKPKPKVKIKPTPKVEVKAKVQVKPKAQTTPKVTVKPKKEKKKINLNIGKGFDDILDWLDWRLSGFRNLIVGFCIFMMWFFGWCFSLVSMISPFMAQGLDAPYIIFPISIVSTILLVVIHNKLEGSFKKGLLLFGLYSLVIGIITCIMAETTPFGAIAYSMLANAQDRDGIVFMCLFVLDFLLVYIMPTLILSMAMPFKNRYYD